MTREQQLWEQDLREAGWTSFTAHPNSPAWLAPDGKAYPGPGYAWLVMTEIKLRDGQIKTGD